MLQGILANVFGQFGTALIQLIGVPVYLHFWGVGQYGEWLLLYTIPAYFGLADIGLGTVAANEICIRVAKQDTPGALAVFDTVFFMIVWACIVLSSLVFMACWGLPLFRWFQFEHLSEGQFFFAIGVFLAYAIVAMISGLLITIYRSEGAYARGQFISNLLRITEFAAIMLGVLAGQQMLFAALALLSTRLLGVLFIYQDLSRRYAWFRLRLGAFDRAMAKGLFRPALAFFAFPLGNVLLNQALLGLVAKSLGPAAVVTFSTLRTLANFIRQLVSTINQSAWPEFSALFAKKELGAANKLFQKIVQFSFWLISLAIVFLWLLTPFFLNFWTLGKVSVAQPFYGLLLVSVALTTLWNTSMVVPLSVNKHAAVSLYFVLGALVAFLWAGFWVSSWGLVAIATALLLVDLVMLPITFRQALLLLEGRFGSLLRGLLDFSFLRKLRHGS